MSDNPIVRTSMLAPATMCFTLANKGKPLVDINLHTGEVKFGETYTPDEAARLFWHALSQHYRDMTQWRPIETAPKDGTPILAWCVHEADPYFMPDDDRRLTTYGANCEGLTHVTDGWNVVVWGGEYRGTEGDYMPNWWFLNDGYFENPANPVYWVPVPDAPKEDE